MGLCSSHGFRGKLGYVLLTLEGEKPDFETREKVIFLPECELEMIKNYLFK